MGEGGDHFTSFGAFKQDLLGGRVKIHPAAERQLRDAEPDAEDLALLEHIFGEDRPPQGLHQRGWKQTLEEQDWFGEWLYPMDYDDLL